MEIEVDNESEWDEIEQKLRERDFASFLVSERTYEDENWEFDDLEPLEEDNDGEAA